MSGSSSCWRSLAAMPIVGILRGFKAEHMIPIADALMKGGLPNIEVTMNSDGVLEQIQQLIRHTRERMNIGAGTVRTLSELDQALQVGASFIVSPTTQLPILRQCRREGIPVFPGAFSPHEIVQAWENGASMVKVFPAGTSGPEYLRHLKQMDSRIKMMPTGGVDLATLPHYLQAGASGFGIGRPLFNRARIEARDWGWLAGRARAFRQAYEQARSTPASRLA